MLVQVRLFARARDLAGTDAVTIDVPEGACVADLRRALATRCSQLTSLLQRSAIAVNGELVDDGDTLPTDAEIALLPPVSGG